MEISIFNETVEKHSKKIFNYLLKILRYREDAEDILQDVFLAFYQKWQSVNPEFYQAYLYKTAYHKALNHIKKNKKKEVQLSDNLDFLPDTEQFMHADPSEKIRFAIQKLSIKDATILELKFFQKKNYQEISAIMSMSVRAVDSRLVRAKKKLRKIFMQEFSDSDV
jgi:RNA polymerase sigma-70 factor (ECF subfamily)